MNLLITGIAGFIGYNLAEKLLKEGHTVIGIDNLNSYYDVKLKKDRLKNLSTFKNLFFYDKDIADYNSLEEIVSLKKPSILINLAAQAGVRYSLKKPQVYNHSNLTGFLNILEICRNFDIKLIYASSSSVYGNSSKEKFKEEDYTDRPISLYAATKKSNEVMAYSYSSLYKIPTVGFRFFTVYGPYGRPDMAVFLFTDKILRGNKIKLFNNGDMYRDFTYISDITSGIVNGLSFIESDSFCKNPVPYEIFNLGYGQTRKLSDFVKIIEKNCNKKADVFYEKLQKGDVLKTSADIGKAQRLLNYRPSVNLEKGILEYVSWFRRYYSI